MKSRVKGDFQARRCTELVEVFRENVIVKFPCETRLEPMQEKSHAEFFYTTTYFDA